MGYAVLLTFDAFTERAVRGIWQAIAAAGVTTPDQLGAIPPHITLAGYSELALADCRATLAAVASATAPLSVTLANLGLFPPSADEAVIFAAPTVTSTLLGVHGQVCGQLAASASAPWPYYRPGAWVPHCTLTQHCPADQLAAILTICQTLPLPLSGQVAGIRVIDTTTFATLCHYPLTGTVQDREGNDRANNPANARAS